MIRDRIAHRLDSKNNGSHMGREWAKRARISRCFDCEQRGHKVAKGAQVTHFMENSKLAVASGLTNGVALGSSEFQVLRPSEKWLRTTLLISSCLKPFVKKP